MASNRLPKSILLLIHSENISRVFKLVAIYINNLRIKLFLFTVQSCKNMVTPAADANYLSWGCMHWWALDTKASFQHGSQQTTGCIKSAWTVWVILTTMWIGVALVHSVTFRSCPEAILYPDINPKIQNSGSYPYNLKLKFVRIENRKYFSVSFYSTPGFSNDHMWMGQW